jgi:hypothetical protein
MVKASFLSPTCIEALGLQAKDICTLSRLLKEKLTEDQPMEVWRGDMKCLEVKSIFKAAGKTLLEEPYIHYAKYVPFKKWEAIEKTQ